MRHYNDPPPNLMHGIHLVQSGLRREALPYLRLAMRSELVIADGWLWLAAATDDLEEYRHAVLQALKLDPDHPVARRMRATLEQQGAWTYGRGAGQQVSGATIPATPWPREGLLVDSPTGDTMPSQRLPVVRRVLRVIGLLLVLVLCVGGAGAVLLFGGLADSLQGERAGERRHVLDFSVGGPSGFHFRVEVPETWLPADTGNPAWITAREQWAATFPVAEGEIGVWRQVEAPFAEVKRNPVYGSVLPQVRIVETDVTRLDAYGIVTALTLHEIVPLPDPAPGEADDVCVRMQLLARDLQASGALAAQPNTALEGNGLETRDDDCAYWIHRRLTNLAPHEVPFPVTIAHAPDVLREVIIYVPVGTERYAVWRLTLADTAYADYDEAITRIIATLQALDAG